MINLAPSRELECLLVEPPFWSSRGAFTPIGLALLAQVLREAGHTAGILDARLDALTPEEATRRLVERRPRVVGFTSMTMTFPWVARTAALVKEASPETRIILGGCHVTAVPEQSLRETPAAEAAVCGEAEKVIVPLVRALLEPAPALGAIPGLAYRADGVVRVTERPPLVEDLSALPTPAYDLLPMARYRTHRGKRYAGMLTSRGCPGRCKFCYRLTFGGKVRRRRIESVVDEMELLERKYGVEDLCFEDDHFTTSRKWIHGFCEEVRKRKLKAQWICWTRVDGVDPELLSDMKSAGCRVVRYGVESGSQEILDRSGKGTNVQKTIDAFRLTRRAGIQPWAFFMIGNIGETADTVEATIRLAKRLAPDLFYVAMATPYPGTELREWAEERGYILARSWGEYDDYGNRAPMRTEALSGEEIVRLRNKAARALLLSPPWLCRKFLRKVLEPRGAIQDLVGFVRLLRSGTGELASFYRK